MTHQPASVPPQTLRTLSLGPRPPPPPHRSSSRRFKGTPPGLSGLLTALVCTCFSRAGNAARLSALRAEHVLVGTVFFPVLIFPVDSLCLCKKSTPSSKSSIYMNYLVERHLTNERWQVLMN